MATAYTRPEFIDTYWIIPEYSTRPYGKVSPTLISPLRNNLTLAYSLNQHPNKTGAGFKSLSDKADISRLKVRFFYVRDLRCAPIMVRRNGGAFTLAGFFVTGLLIPLRLASLFKSGERGLKEPDKEAATMATTQTRSKFTDTYWIIPEYSTRPYGKVSPTLISPLRNNLTLAYSLNQHLNKTGAGFDSLSKSADRISRHKVRFFYVRFLRCAPIMVGRSGGASALAGFRLPGLSIPLRLATLFDSGLVRLHKLQSEAKTMAITKPVSKFIDTYWIVSKDSNTPSSKIAFTRNDRRIFNALFKDSRLIWAGRQPVHAGMEGN